MYFEHLLKRENGDKIAIVVKGIYNYSTHDVFSIADVRITPKRKQKFTSIETRMTDNYSYRKLDSEGRQKMMFEEFLKHVTIDEINKALESAWLSTKPKPIIHLILD